MEDIAPRLWDELRKEFDRLYDNDKNIQRFLSHVEKGTAVSEDAAKYSMYVGECAAEAMKKILVPERLPYGKLYFNIAERTVRPLLTMVYELVNDAGMKVLEAENKKKKIGLKPIKGTFPEDRIKGFIDRLVEISMGEERDG